jgi:DNA-binding CsgD family transcriptional regulator
MSNTGSSIALVGRDHECAKLTSLLTGVRDGRSQVLVLRGEAGIGKSALLDYLLGQAAGCRVGRAAGVESEMELAFAGVHQLCGPYLDRMPKLPAPQRNALATVLGLHPGDAPDRFLVGLAVLTLLCDVAESQPLICLVEDAQWLDQASAQTLEFVARRLAAEPVAIVFAVRQSGDATCLVGLPELPVGGLSSADAALLLDSAVPGSLDPRVRERILDESRGNPLALLELPKAFTTTDLVFGGAPRRSTGAGLTNRLEQEFLRQLTSLPDPAQQLVLAAAAEPVGDVGLLLNAAARLGIGRDAAASSEVAGLIELGAQVRFRHPLVRSAVYQAAAPAERRAVHQALADATDPSVDPDRRAWHRARATLGTDESVAADLESSAGRALAVGGFASAAAFLEAAAALTPDPVRRAQRALDAGQAKATAGAFGEAAALLSVAEAGPIDEAARVRIDLVRAQMSYNASHGNEALPLLLAAAQRLEALDARLARETYLDALSAALFAGRLSAGDALGMRQVAERIRRLPTTEGIRKTDLLLDGLATLYTDGYAAAAPVLHSAVDAFGREDLTVEEAFRSAWVAAVAAVDLWDDVHWDLLSQRHLDVVRNAGALSLLPLGLASRAIFDIHSGNLSAAASLVAESKWLAEVTSGENSLPPIPEAWLAAMRGQERQAELLIEDTLSLAKAAGQGVGLNMMYVARAVLCNGLGRYEDAVIAAHEAATEPLELGPTKWALAELVEAGVRTGRRDVAVEAFEELSTMARASGTDYALGIAAARCALVSDDHSAEDRYAEAIERLSRTRMRIELARARLLYGEWLRRQSRRVDARTQLRAAHDAFDAMGMEAFASRAQRELLATGETVRKRTVDTDRNLTAHEASIARLATEGFTSREIAAQLYVSPRTVEWHLRKIFAKVGVTNRRELREALAQAHDASSAGSSG